MPTALQDMRINLRCFDIRGEIAQKLGDFPGSHVPGMALVVKQDVAISPSPVSFTGSIAIMKCTNYVTKLVPELSSHCRVSPLFVTSLKNNY